MILALISIFQKFDLSLVDPSYNLELKQTLTIKPKDFRIRAALRTAPKKHKATPSATLPVSVGAKTEVSKELVGNGTTPLYVLYGSNTGTSEGFAQRIASDAPSYGKLLGVARIAK